MKIIKSKKSEILFNITLVLVTIIVLTTAFFVLANKKDNFPSGIGGRQAEIIKTYQKADKMLLYVDESATFSVEQALYDLGQNGGYNTVPDCGKITDYMIWQSKSKDCYPKFINNFNFLLNENLNIYLDSYPNPKLKTDNYEFTIYNNKVIGTALENIILPIFDEKNIAAGRYSIKPSFNVDLIFNIDHYDNLITQTKEIFIKCENEIDKKQCVNNILITSSYSNLKSTNLGDVFFFNVTTNEKVWVYDGTKLEEKELVIKLGLDFS
jgi:hypothetical protein